MKSLNFKLQYRCLIRDSSIAWVTLQYPFFFLQINEFVDARDLNMGAWFEAQIVNITKTTKTPGEEEGSD